ncbi:MAG: tRNA dihydrouridine synthase DusB, partial [Mesorhizobium sp.]
MHLATQCAAIEHAWFLCMPELTTLASPLDVGGVRIRNRVFLA